MVETCAAFGVAADRRDGHPGCWVDAGWAATTQDRRARHPRRARRQLPRDRPERAIPYLADFDLIDACGMPDVVSTSIALEAGRPGRGAVDRRGRARRRDVRRRRSPRDRRRARWASRRRLAGPAMAPKRPRSRTSGGTRLAGTR